MFRLDGKVAVITGAGGVICSALAKDISRYGANVALLDLNVEAARKVVGEIETEIFNGQQGRAIAIQTDVLDKASIVAAAQEVLKVFGKADILINGAGGNHPKATTGPDMSFFDMPADSIKWVYDLNFIGSVLPSQVFGKLMADQGEGCIVNIASMASYRPLTRSISYSSAKAAVVNFTEWLAVHCCKEYSAKIRVNAIAPGFLLTEQNRFLMQQDDGSLTQRGATVIEKTPMARFGTPDELSGAVIYLCSEAASFVTGVVIPVDGGFNAFSGV